MIGANWEVFDWSVAMRRVVVAAMIIGAVSGARAADLSDLPILRGSVTEGLTTSAVNWQGFYIGGQGAYGTSDMNFTNATRTDAARLLDGLALEAAGQVSSWPIMGKNSVHGSGIGAFAGYNGQWDDVVLGVEFNYLHAKFNGLSSGSMGKSFTDAGGYTDGVTYQGTARMSISDMGTIRARAGYAFSAFLPYMFGGIALGQADILKTVNITGIAVNASATPPFNSIPINYSTTNAINSHLIYGYSAGLGADVMLVSCLFLRAEWEYVRFTSSIDTSVNTVRVGLGYKF
jgi:opacity protein-like surface antigen